MTPPRWRACGAGTACLLSSIAQSLRATALSIDRRHLQSPFLADVYGADPNGGSLQHDQNVELLRFVTAYGTGLDALVDLTPYSPLLEAGRLSNGNASSSGLTFYAFIDTWVNNGTGVDAMYMDNITGQCSPIVRSQGNGWLLSADLIFYPPDSSVPAPAGSDAGGLAGASQQTHGVARPKHSLTLASGYYGGNFPFGDVSVHVGNLSSQGQVVFSTPVAMYGAADAKVYACPGGEQQISHSARLGYVSHQAEALAQKGKHHMVQNLVNMTFESLATEHLVSLTDTALLGEEVVAANVNQSVKQWRVKAVYDSGVDTPVPGMPVYFMAGDVFMAQEMSTGVWWNLTYPFQPVGSVLSSDGNGTLELTLDLPCAPTNMTKLNSTVPHLQIPKTMTVLPALHAQIAEAAQIGIARAQDAANQTFGNAGGRLPLAPLLLQPPLQGGDVNSMFQTQPEGGAHLMQPQCLGHIALDAAPMSAVHMLHGQSELEQKESTQQVCVIEQWQQGRLFERAFDLPNLADGDRVLLQLAVTGHGWSATTEQCGEYCHALYQPRINGADTHSMYQFRNDCKANPIGLDGNNHGTWWESRNGWCPGSVEPGMFVDISHWVHSGSNHLALDVLVWNNITHVYDLYTDYSGFAFNDHASLTVGLNLFVYGADAVAAANALDQPFTAAEAALRNGVGGVGVVDPMGPPATDEGVVQLHQVKPSTPRRQIVSPPAKAEPRSGLALLESSHAAVTRRLPEHHQARIRFPYEEAELMSADGDSVGPSGSKGSSDTYAVYLREVGRRVEATRVLDGAPNFEARAPWYLLNETNGSTMGTDFIRVPAITGALMQGAQRTVSAHVDASALPSDWSRVAVHFQLQKPPNELAFDHWDRLGSFGLKLGSESTPGLKLHPMHALPPQTTWNLT